MLETYIDVYKDMLDVIENVGNKIEKEEQIKKSFGKQVKNQQISTNNIPLSFAKRNKK